MSEVPRTSPEFNEPPLDRVLIVGRLHERGIEEELDYLFDESLDDNDVIGEILTLVTMYDMDMDDILPEITPIEERNRKWDYE